MLADMLEGRAKKTLIVGRQFGEEGKDAALTLASGRLRLLCPLVLSFLLNKTAPVPMKATKSDRRANRFHRR